MNLTKCLAITISVTCASVPLSTTPVRAFDMDCSVLLCMAGGFPSEPTGICSAAKAYMIARITPWPVLSPFGVCTFPGISLVTGKEDGTTETYTPSHEELPFLDALAIDFGTRYSYGGGENDIPTIVVTMKRCRTSGGNTEISGNAAGCPTAFSFSTSSRTVGPCTSRGGRDDGCKSWGPATTPNHRIKAEWDAHDIGGAIPTHTRGLRVQYADQNGTLDWTDWVYY